MPQPSTSAGGGGAGGGGGDGAAGSGAGGAGPACDAGPDEDRDGDGFTITQGDCNDCDAAVNPNAVEGNDTDSSDSATSSGVPGVDDDCDQLVDEPMQVCDQALDVADEEPRNAARAVDLCKESSGSNDWGLISARWVMADGSDPPTAPPQVASFHRGHGFVSGFGPNVPVRIGERMLALSSGAGRQPADAGYVSPSGYDKQYGGQSGEGLPQTTPSCPELLAGAVFDPTGVELEVLTPSNAHGFSFAVNFYTYDWPSSICSPYNDFFVGLLSPSPPGIADGQIVLDPDDNALSVNSVFLDVCGCLGGPPCTTGGKEFQCTRGTSELVGTGFENHAATSWLRTTTPVEPNQVITIRWSTYDSGDHISDSTALVDGWHWVTTPDVSVSTSRDVPQ